MNPQGIESNVKMTVAQPNPKSWSQLKNCAEMKASNPQTLGFPMIGSWSGNCKNDVFPLQLGGVDCYKLEGDHSMKENVTQFVAQVCKSIPQKLTKRFHTQKFSIILKKNSILKLPWQQRNLFWFFGFGKFIATDSTSLWNFPPPNQKKQSQSQRGGTFP